VSPDEVQVEERQGYLTIRLERKQEDEHEQSGWQWRQRRYGAWQRTVQLPETVKGEKARAELRDGILTVTLPKVQPTQKLVNRIKVSLPKVGLPRLGKKEKTIKVTH
jgi:HSP20 family protein